MSKIMFLWENKVIKVTEQGEFVLIDFDNKKSEKMKKSYFEYLQTENSIPNDQFFLNKTHKVISDIMQLFIDSWVNLHEVSSIINGLVKSVETNKDISISKLFDVEFTSHITFAQINDIVVKSNVDDKSTV